MKRIISILISISLILISVPAFAMSGSGTEANPYLVSTPQDVCNIHNDLDGYYKLTADIDMSGVYFTLIGNEDEGAFTGVIDGDGHTISNLNIDLSETKYVGFIGYLEGMVKDLTISNAYVCGYRYVGGIAGYAETTASINNCSFNGTINAEYRFGDVNTGGIVGYNNGIISQCKNYGSLTALSGYSSYNNTYYYAYVGGICGYTTQEINYCENYGSIIAPCSCVCVGGICGYSDSLINQCFNYGIVKSTGSSANTGGIAGRASTIRMCANNGNIIGGTGGSGYSVYVGGIAGSSYIIEHSINSGVISREEDTSASETYVGGISGSVGYIDDNTPGINMCVNNGFINLLNGYNGGIVGATYSGYWYNPGEMRNCINYDKRMIGYNAYGYFTSMQGKISSSINLSNVHSLSFTPDRCDIENVYDWIENGTSVEVNTTNHLYKSDLRDTSNLNNFDFEDAWTIKNEYNSGLPTIKQLPKHLELNKTAEILYIGDSMKLKAFIDETEVNVKWVAFDNCITVDNSGMVTAVKTGNSHVTAIASNGMVANCFIRIIKQPSDIAINESHLTIPAGNYGQLDYTEFPADSNENVIWSSSNADVVYIDQNGQIRANQRGTAIITCQTVSTYRISSCVVDVVGNPITSIYISPNYATMNIGEQYKIPLSISPQEYSGTITYLSSDDSVVEMSTNGEATAKRVGTAVITAMSDTNQTATCTITVKAPVTELSFEKKDLSLEQGYTQRLKLNIVPLNTTDTISWASSDDYYASVSSDGVITANSVGTATITATSESGKKAYCVVNVTEPTISVSSVTLNKTEIIMTQADKTQLTAEVLPSNATNKDLIWSSSDEAVATVSNTGVVTAVDTGAAIITATSDNGFYAECSINVVAANGASFITKSTKAQAGEIAEYTVSVVKNPGMSAYKLSLDYDTSKLEPIEIIGNSEIGGTFSTNLEEPERSILNVLWYADNDYTENADLFTVKFKVKDGVTDGTEIPVTLSYNSGDVCNAKHQNLAFFIDNTIIEVSAPILGDVYEDGELNVHDILVLSRAITGLETLTDRQKKAANLIDDTDIDIKDTVKLAQILLGQPKLMAFKLMSFAGTPTVTVGSESINDKTEIEIPVSISENSGFAGFNFKIDYNRDELEIVSITPNSDMLTDEFKTNLGEEGENGLLVSWYSTKNITNNGNLFTIKARCKKAFDGNSIISIVPADNNFCDDTPKNVIVNYVDGNISYSKFIKQNEIITDTTYSVDCIFDSNFSEQSATGIVAFYDEVGRLLSLSSDTIQIAPGTVHIELPKENKAYHKCKFMIWDSLTTLRPIVKAK